MPSCPRARTKIRPMPVEERFFDMVSPWETHADDHGTKPREKTTPPARFSTAPTPSSPLAPLHNPPQGPTPAHPT